MGGLKAGEVWKMRTTSDMASDLPKVEVTCPA